MGKEQVRWLTIVISPRCVVRIALKQSQEVGLLPVEAVSVQYFALFSRMAATAVETGNSEDE